MSPLTWSRTCRSAVPVAVLILCGSVAGRLDAPDEPEPSTPPGAGTSVR